MPCKNVLFAATRKCSVLTSVKHTYISVLLPNCFLFELNLNFICASITYVEIEETCPFFGAGRDHKGLGEISTSKKHSLPY